MNVYLSYCTISYINCALTAVCIINYLILIGLCGNRVCTIYSPNVTTNGAMMDIPSGIQNVILYCVCRRDNVAVGPTTWFINGTAVTHTTASGDNPYYRNNIPSPLIIPLLTATHAGTYGCEGSGSTRVTIIVAVVGMCN